MSSTNWSVDKRHAPIVVLTSRDITSVGIWTTEIAPYVVLRSRDLLSVGHWTN